MLIESYPTSNAARSATQLVFAVRANIPIDETLQCANAMLNTIRVLSDERCDADAQATQALNHAIDCLTQMSNGLVSAPLQGLHETQ
ncbi:hypothetical protein PMM47T1_18595 [Pseudomonas sp. M47T1]|nr:hypothetical protein PMM47T1_18595 [Pseudomonas sp. M47T1]